MAQLTNVERLEKVKTALGISGNYQDAALDIYVNDVLDIIISSGVSEAVAKSAAAIGCIVIGVNDLYNYSSGDVKFSDAFGKRLVQLAHSV